MTSARGITTAVIVVLVVGVGLWALVATRTEVPQERSPAIPLASPEPRHSAPVLTPSRPPSGYRLAGVSAGTVRSFVAVEMPDGTSELFRLGDDVPGLGRLVGVEPKRATFAGEHGTFTMQVGPKPTPTGTAERDSSPLERRTATPASDEADLAPAAGEENFRSTESS